MVETDYSKDEKWCIILACADLFLRSCDKDNDHYFSTIITPPGKRISLRDAQDILEEYLVNENSR